MTCSSCFSQAYIGSDFNLFTPEYIGMYGGSWLEVHIPTGYFVTPTHSLIF